MYLQAAILRVFCTRLCPRAPQFCHWPSETAGRDYAPTPHSTTPLRDLQELTDIPIHNLAAPSRCALSGPPNLRKWTEYWILKAFERLKTAGAQASKATPVAITASLLCQDARNTSSEWPVRQATCWMVPSHTLHTLAVLSSDAVRI